ncbi:MAG TPA: NAD-dependent epimerase/dehydratase family protein [Patescibacteria group bacterium]|nr:NAD-dependent epimerase/dehydratase family protein [Patescibacteria group bacterium]
MAKHKIALVTGGAGFIGSHIVDALIRRRIKVYVIDDLSTGSRKNLNPNATFYKLSIVDQEAVTKLIARIKPDVVFHLAAQIDVRCSVEDPPADARVNVVGTLNVAHASAKVGVKKFIFTSSGGAMYPDTRKPPYSEKTPEEPLSPYAIAKRSAEMYLDFEHRIHGMKYVVLRLANAYGPRQALRGGYAGVISVFARQMLAGDKIVINGNGKQTRDYVFVGDIVRAHMLAMDKAVTGTFNIGTGIQTTVNSLFSKIKRLTGSKQKEVHGPACKGEVMRSALDARKAARELGWKPDVSLEEGLKKTVLWFKNI